MLSSPTRGRRACRPPSRATSCAAAPARALDLDVNALDLPRSRRGLDVYYELVARTTGDLWSAGGGRWMHAAGGAGLLVERVVAKDNYETPGHIWRHAIAAHRLDRDAHASSLNAVLPEYASRRAPGLRANSRYWLNPAFGAHCGGIGRVLAAHVWREGCAVVALLPALLHTSWWHAYVMRADSLFYLREKLRFTNPFLDDVAGDYFYSFVIACWEATPAAEAPVMKPLDLPRADAAGAAGQQDAAQLLRVRRCRACGKYRVLPRHQAEPANEFVCSALADPQFASCASPCPVWLLD